MIHVHFGFTFVNATSNGESFVYLEDKMITEEVNYHGKLLNAQFQVTERYNSYVASGVLIDRYLIGLT